jgi:metallophosphoesterase superfamily enzyme
MPFNFQEIPSPKNSVIFNHPIPYVKIRGKEGLYLPLPAFKFSINKMVFPAIFDTGSDMHTISKKTALEIGIEEFLIFYPDVTLEGVGTLPHCKVNVGDFTQLDNVPVQNVGRVGFFE